MARRYTLLSSRNRLIPRIEVAARKREWKADPNSAFSNKRLQVEYTDFIAEECSVQPMRGKAQRDQNNQLQPVGEEDYDSYTVYSETFLLHAKEGTDKLSDQLLLPDSNGGETWFTVMKTDIYVSSGVRRFRYYVVAVPAGTEGGL